MSLYEIRAGGVTMCASQIPMLGYTEKRLRQMMADGYKYYIDGKYVRKLSEAGK